MGAQWKAKGKAQAASQKGKLFTKLAKEVTVAARGGADPDFNPRLRMAIEQARKNSMPKDTLDRAIKKGAGLTGEVVNYETVVYEGFAPHRVPVIVECLTDNNNRTSQSIRVLFRKGQLGALGSVSWDFSHIGLVEAAPANDKADPDEAAIESGAQDLEPGENGHTVFITATTDLYAVARALPALGFNVVSAELSWRAKNPVTLTSEEQQAEVEAFLAAIDEDDDVQNIYVGLA